MAKNNSTLSQARLKELLHYDPDTGVFTWKVKSAYNIEIGNVTGCVTILSGKKYIVIRVIGKLYLAHRLAWLYMTGSFPIDEIDHADGNGINNIFKNLSSVTHLKNHKNIRLHVRNTSGINGVSWHSENKRWRARIKVNYKNISLGCFTDIKDAIKARKNADIKYGFHPNHGADRPL